MKKLLSILLVIVMCASMMTLTAFAAESGSMSATSAEIAAGSSGTISVSLTSNPGVMAYQIVPSVPEGISITMTGTGMGGGVWTTGKNAFWDNASDSTYTGKILDVAVTVDTTVAPGTYTITFATGSGSNYDEEDVTFGSCTATITVPKPVCNHIWDDGNVTKAATCTEAGVKTYTCTVSGCGETKTETINAIGHKWGEWTETKAPTCTEAGEKTRVCANDASHKETDEIAATGHKWNDGEVTTAAGCETTGVKTYTCTVDGCGATKTEEIPANGHSYGEWKETKAPTCTEKGEETHECACGKTETREIEAKGHALNSYGKDSTHHWALCDNCDHVGAKEAHSYDYNGVCVCGAKKPVVDDPNLDDVPKTGDITPYITMSVASIIALAAAAAFVLKRKAVK